MTQPAPNLNPDSISGEDIYLEINSLSKKLTTGLLLRMIESAEDFHNWDLSDPCATRIANLLRYKQRVICSSFSFQLNKHFAEFKSGEKSIPPKKEAREGQVLSPGANGAAESGVLQKVTPPYSGAFKEFDQTILKRLQACIKRPHADIFESPLQLKKLCESFQHTIDSIDLKASDKVAIYALFAGRFIKSLGPLYRRIDRALIDHGILPEMPAASIQLGSSDGLSESASPASVKLDQTACLLKLFERYKEASRDPSNQYNNLFPELKQHFASLGLHEYDGHIDQLDLMFKLIFEDEDLPLPVKQQLARLQIFILNTAIREDGFLRRSSNPARRLLDGIIASEVEIAKSRNPGFSGAQFIRKHINDLTSRGFISLDGYATMLKDYQAHLKGHEVSSRETSGQKASKQVLSRVKSTLSEITQPLRALGTPMILFDKVWSPLMLQIALQQGIGSKAWHESVAMIQKQVWTLTPKSTREERQELKNALPLATRSLQQAMDSLKLPESLQQSLGHYLKLEHQGVIEKVARNIIEAIRKTRSLSARSFDTLDGSTGFEAMLQTGLSHTPTDTLNAPNSVKPEKNGKISQVEALTIGTWVDIKQGGEKKMGKVAGISENASHFVFVDYVGNKILEVDGLKLAEQFESGDVSLITKNTADSDKTLFSFMKSL